VKGDPERIGIRRLWREIREWLDDHYRDRVLISEWGNPELAIDAGFHADFMQHVGVAGYDALVLGPRRFRSVVPRRTSTAPVAATSSVSGRRSSSSRAASPGAG
jgi:hypothetical protein